MSNPALVLLALLTLFAFPLAQAHPELDPTDPISDITVLDKACIDPEGPAVSLSGGCAQTACDQVLDLAERCRGTMP